MNGIAAELGLSAAYALGDDQDHVVSRRDLYAARVPRWLVRRELRVGRWNKGGRQSIVLHNGPLSTESRRRIALIELGPRAALAGVTSLQSDGVTALTDSEIHVIAPPGVTRRSLAGVMLHESRRFSEADVCSTGIRRTNPAVSAVHAGLWSKTEKQAVFMLVLAVQQDLCTPKQLADAMSLVRRHRWRIPMLTAIADLTGGVRRLGELDVARAMRSRGLPEPDRQVMRRRPSGKEYLDADFEEYGISLEVDGEQHDLPWAWLNDLVRDIGRLSEGRTPVRISLMAWRVDKERVLDALEELFRSRGWLPHAA